MATAVAGSFYLSLQMGSSRYLCILAISGALATRLNFDTSARCTHGDGAHVL